MNKNASKIVMTLTLAYQINSYWQNPRKEKTNCTYFYDW